MTAILSGFHAATHTAGGQTTQIGSLLTPYREITIDGVVMSDQVYTLPIDGSTIEVWSYNRFPQSYKFESMTFEILDTGGVIFVAWFCDAKPLVAPFAPTGVAPVWYNAVAACGHPVFGFNSSEVLVNATVATAVGTDGLGDPALWANAATTTGRIWKVKIKNALGTPVRVRVRVID